MTAPRGPTLRGMTWSHPRGYDPMVACSALWQAQTGVRIAWDKRSLQDFESYPVEELARAYDLIVIDHPHVGQITAQGCLAPLDVPGREAERAALAAGSVGQSYPSYEWQGRQSAFPIDAATQVLAWRPDLLSAMPKTWETVLKLAQEGRVLLPLRPPHSLMTFYTLAGSMGLPLSVAGPELIGQADGERVFDRMLSITTHLDSICATMDPIAVFEVMAATDSQITCAPLIYGYVSYAMEGFRPHRIAFADMPVDDDSILSGSALGGTGVAVSAFSQARDAAIDFAYWIASAEVQRGPYAAAGGQPGHSAAWQDAVNNAATADFYAGTRATLDSAWVRPRHDGYMKFQAEASELMTESLMKRKEAKPVITEFNRLFAASF